VLVAILSPDHLFEQADKLVGPSAGRPRQVDIRRAISASYYAIFHAIITAAVDQFIGVTNRDQSRYGLVYRSVNHAWLRDLCKEVQKPTLSNKSNPMRLPKGSVRILPILLRLLSNFKRGGIPPIMT
jgi:hypothetical protein